MLNNTSFDEHSVIQHEVTSVRAKWLLLYIKTVRRNSFGHHLTRFLAFCARLVSDDDDSICDRHNTIERRSLELIDTVRTLLSSIPSLSKKMCINNNNNEQQEQELQPEQQCSMPHSWPEEDTTSNFLSRLYQRWTYSYMTRVLKIGSEQAKNSDVHLTQEDLYYVPPEAQAHHLAKLF